MQISFFELPNHISRLILSVTVLIVIISLYFNELKRVVTRREILLQVEICPVYEETFASSQVFYPR